MASMAPSASGQHQWVSEFAPRRWHRPSSFTAGWLACIAWQSISATDCYIIADVLQALITITKPGYLPTRWTATLLTILTVMALSAWNVLAARHITIAEGVFMTCHVFAFVPIFVTLWVMVEPKKSITEAFFTFHDKGRGWAHPSLSALVGQISCIFAASGCDSAIHLAEKADDGALTIPRGMFWAFVMNFPLALIMLVTYCVNIGSVDDALSGKYPPFVAVFRNALDSQGAVTAFTTILLALLVMVTINALAATSRQLFAFARDNGLPFSKDLSHAAGYSQVPVNAFFATACTTSVFALIQLGSSSMVDSSLALACAALMATSGLSIGCLVLRRLRKQRLPHAQWSLGRFGLPINCCAIVYAAFAFFWSLWPSQRHITAASFNWAPVLLAAITGYAAAAYHVHGWRTYEATFVTELEESVRG